MLINTGLYNHFNFSPYLYEVEISNTTWQVNEFLSNIFALNKN